MILYLIRHLPTDWNQSGKLQGRVDRSILDLTESDQHQIRKNLKALEDREFSIVLTSTLTRTKQTAKSYGFTKFIPDPLIDELDFGEFEGKSKELLLDDLRSKWYEHFLEIKLGESGIEFQGRLQKFLIKYRAHKSLLVFTHGAVIRGLVALAREKNIQRMNKEIIGNNELVTCEFNETFLRKLESEGNPSSIQTK